MAVHVEEGGEHRMGRVFAGGRWVDALLGEAVEELDAVGDGMMARRRSGAEETVDGGVRIGTEIDEASELFPATAVVEMEV